MAKPSKPTKRAKLAKPKPAKPRPAKPAKPAKPKPAKPAKPAKPKPAKLRPAKPKPPKPRPAKLRTREEPPEEAAHATAAPMDTARSDRATHIATLAAERARTGGTDDDPQADPALDAPRTGGPVTLGSITVPSGTLAIFDVGLMGYLPREALDPLLICTPVPSDRALAVIGVRTGKGRFAGRWDHVAIELAGPERRELAHARKLGEAAVDFGRLLCIDRAAIDHWRHEDSLDQLADVAFWGPDEAALARTLGATRLPHGEGHGWANLPLAEAEAKADRAAQLKAENKWRLTTELRPHSHHFYALAAAGASPTGAGVLEVDGARALLFSTSWGEGVSPVYLDADPDGRPIQIRVQLAPTDAKPPPGTRARPPAW